MKERVLYLLKFYVVTVFIFVIAKIVFILYNISRDDLTLLDLLQVMRHGMSLDLSMTLYLLAIPFLLVIASFWLQIPKWAFRIYYGITSFMLSLAFVADTSLYEFWGFKLNSSCLQYLETPIEAMASVSTGYILIRVLCVALCSWGIYWIYDKLTPTFTTASHRIIGTLVAILLIPLIVIGIRGGVDESTTNVGQVYYSSNLFLNHSAVNPVFSFISSFEHGEKDYYHYNYFDKKECDKILEGVYSTQSVGIDTLLTTQRPKHVVVIILESCGAIFTELGGNKETMPHFNQLMKESVCFTQCYANSWRTDRGTVCILSGWPSFPNVSIMKMPDKSQTMPSIAKSLKSEGYHTQYLYGGDINFTNMKSYLVATGWEKLYSEEDFSLEERKDSKWGVRDDITFETLYKLIAQSSTPQLMCFSTLSSHEPWEVPLHQFDDEKANSFYYLDKCINTFIQKLKHTGLWKETLVIMISDHGIQYKDLNETKPLRNLIPMVWCGGVIKSPQIIEKICNQSDFAATLLGQLGIPHDKFTFSRDVMSRTYRYPTAVHNYNNAQSMIDSTGFILYDFDAEQFLKNESKDTKRMLNVSKAILQKTTSNLKERQ